MVLSVNEVKEKDKLKKLSDNSMLYANVLHKELIEEVQNNLSDYFMASDDRHLMFLKEYIADVKSFYPNNNRMKDMDKVFEMFLEKSKEIKKIVKKDAELLEYVNKTLDKIMLNNFYNSRAYRNKGQVYSHFYYKPGGILTKNLRFWFNVSGIKEYGILEGYYEIYNDSAIDKSEILVKDINFNNNSLTTDTYKGKNYAHLVHIKIDLRDIISEGFEINFAKRLEECIFKTEWFKKINVRAEANLIMSAVSNN